MYYYSAPRSRADVYLVQKNKEFTQISATKGVDTKELNTRMVKKLLTTRVRVIYVKKIINSVSEFLTR